CRHIPARRRSYIVNAKLLRARGGQRSKQGDKRDRVPYPHCVTFRCASERPPAPRAATILPPATIVPGGDAASRHGPLLVLIVVLRRARIIRAASSATPSPGTPALLLAAFGIACGVPCPGVLMRGHQLVLRLIEFAVRAYPEVLDKPLSAVFAVLV